MCVYQDRRAHIYETFAYASREPEAILCKAPALLAAQQGAQLGEEFKTRNPKPLNPKPLNPKPLSL